MQKKTMQYYDYKDIKDELCKNMGITDDQFHGYHEVIGGEFKSLWHLYLEYFAVQNDSYQFFNLDPSYPKDIIKDLSEEDVWQKPFREAMDKIMEEYKINHVGVDYIHYSW